jgi:hypothetical protein
MCELVVIDVSSRFPQNVGINTMQQGLINKKATYVKVTKITDYVFIQCNSMQCVVQDAVKCLTC